MRQWFLAGALLFAVEAILVSACCSAATAMPTSTMGPIDVVKAYEDAYNRHDVPAVMAILAEDAVYKATNYGFEFKTPAEIQKLHEFYSGGNIEVHFIDCQVSAGTVSCNQTQTEDCVRAFGLDPVPGQEVFTILNNKIQQIEWSIGPNGLDQFDPKWEHFTAWFQQTYPDEWATITSDNAWLTKETGIIVGKRCYEFAQTQ